MVMMTVMMMVMVLMRSPQGSCRSGYFEDDGDGDDDGDISIAMMVIYR